MDLSEQTENIETKEKTVMERNVDYVCSQFLSGFLPPPDMDIAEWADKYRILPKASASEHGQWRNERTPYLVEIMKELSPQSMAEEVAFMKPVQVGGTELLINFVLYSIMYDPCPIGVFEPDEMLTRKLMRRITSAAKEMGIENYFTESTMYEKTFPGGQLYAGWSSSESHLRSAPMKKVAGDETGSWVEDCEGFGDPVALMRDRTTTFAQKKIFNCSTPGVNIPEKNSYCRIFSRYELGDQRIFKVPCPHCGMMHDFRWDNEGCAEGDEGFVLVWDKDENGKHLPETARMKCPSCGKCFGESYKDEILKLGQWFKTNPEGKFPSFALNAMYSPLGWCSWKKIVEVFLEAHYSKSVAKMRVFMNNYMGRPFVEVEEHSIDTDSLMYHVENYTSEIPDGVVVLTGSWDTQDNRIEAEIRGWGKDLESWAIKKKVILGNPATDDTVWERLDEFLLSPCVRSDGTTLYPACSLGDAMGHATKAVYSFTGARESRRIYACKGHSDRSKPLTQLPKRTDSSAEYSAKLVNVCVDEAKDMLFSFVKNSKPGTPGYMHFPSEDAYDKKHFDQFGAEKLVVSIKNGKVYQKYVKKKERNEAIDLFNYQLAALDLMRIDKYSINKYAACGKSMKFEPVVASKQAVQRRRLISKGFSA